MTQTSWVLREGHGPVVAVALHDGHAVRADVALFAIAETTAGAKKIRLPRPGQWGY